MDRRRIGVLGGAMLAAAAMAPVVNAEEDNEAHSIEGGWIGNTNAGPAFPPFQALYMFAQGGGMVTSSSIDLSPRSLSTPGYGTWVRQTSDTFTFTFDAFVFDAQGNPTGVVQAHSTVTLNRQGDTFSGPFTFAVMAPNGQIVFSGSGTHEASRIRV